MNARSSVSHLDRAALDQAVAGDRIPSLAFWIDWADTLGTSLEEVAAEARKRVGKESGKPPERMPPEENRAPNFLIHFHKKV